MKINKWKLLIILKTKQKQKQTTAYEQTAGANTSEHKYRDDVEAKWNDYACEIRHFRCMQIANTFRSARIRRQRTTSMLRHLLGVAIHSFRFALLFSVQQKPGLKLQGCSQMSGKRKTRSAISLWNLDLVLRETWQQWSLALVHHMSAKLSLLQNHVIHCDTQ